MKQNSRKKRPRKPDAKDSIRAVLVAGVSIMVALVFSLVIVYHNSTQSSTEQENPLAIQPVESRPVENQPIEASPPPATSPPTARLPEPPPASRGTLVFVIDDAGNNLRDLDPFLKLDIPITIAVLPGLPHSAESARRIRAAGKEVFLHQPMEAIGGQNPGPGAIMTGMGKEEIRAVIRQNLDEVGPVTGMNNHTGSKVTMDEEVMETILALCREKEILFLDSRTTSESAVPRVAKRLGMNIGERDVFLDNVPERDSILTFINMGLEKAEQTGSTIMIGHVQSTALAPLISELLPDLRNRGFSFSTVSTMMNGTGI